MCEVLERRMMALSKKLRKKIEEVGAESIFDAVINEMHQS